MNKRPDHWLTGLIRGYQKFLSPLLGPRCRFYPTCSEYAAQCIEKHGALRGGYLAARRCLKCHPFHPGGIDPVPEPGESKNVRCQKQGKEV